MEYAFPMYSHRLHFSLGSGRLNWSNKIIRINRITFKLRLLVCDFSVAIRDDGLRLASKVYFHAFLWINKNKLYELKYISRQEGLLICNSEKVLIFHTVPQAERTGRLTHGFSFQMPNILLSDLPSFLVSWSIYTSCNSNLSGFGNWRAVNLLSGATPFGIAIRITRSAPQCRKLERACHKIVGILMWGLCM